MKVKAGFMRFILSTNIETLCIYDNTSPEVPRSIEGSVPQQEQCQHSCNKVNNTQHMLLLIGVAWA